VLAQSKNGSGKTGAFGIAMLMAVDTSVRKPQALCMSPTRELALQTCKRLQRLGQFMPGLDVALVIGGIRYSEPVNAQVRAVPALATSNAM